VANLVDISFILGLIIKALGNIFQVGQWLLMTSDKERMNEKNYST